VLKVTVPQPAQQDRTLVAGASVYAKRFSRVPPLERLDLEAELEALPAEERNAITLALWSHPYEVFRDAVRRELLRPVPLPKKDD
jgi:hypothetical protein